jgi:hypothetical protein
LRRRTKSSASRIALGERWRGAGDEGQEERRRGSERGQVGGALLLGPHREDLFDQPVFERDQLLDDGERVGGAIGGKVEVREGREAPGGDGDTVVAQAPAVELQHLAVERLGGRVLAQSEVRPCQDRESLAETLAVAFAFPMAADLQHLLVDRCQLLQRGAQVVEPVVHLPWVVERAELLEGTEQPSGVPAPALHVDCLFVERLGSLQVARRRVCVGEVGEPRRVGGNRGTSELPADIVSRLEI